MKCKCACFSGVFRSLSQCKMHAFYSDIRNKSIQMDPPSYLVLVFRRKGFAIYLSIHNELTLLSCGVCKDRDHHHHPAYFFFCGPALPPFPWDPLEPSSFPSLGKVVGLAGLPKPKSLLKVAVCEWRHDVTKIWWVRVRCGYIEGLDMGAKDGLPPKDAFGSTYPSSTVTHMEIRWYELLRFPPPPFPLLSLLTVRQSQIKTFALIIFSNTERHLRNDDASILFPIIHTQRIDESLYIVILKASHLQFLVLHISHGPWSRPSSSAPSIWWQDLVFRPCSGWTSERWHHLLLVFSAQPHWNISFAC